MKNHLLYFCLLSLSFLTITCTDKENPPIKKEYSEVNEWIYDEMKDNYLWSNEISETMNLSEDDTKKFFNTLLSSKDGKTKNGIHYYYSYITEKEPSSKSYLGEGISLGFEYIYYAVTIESQNIVKRALKVLYVLPESPAEKAGLKRGDWIQTINGNEVNDDLIPILDTGQEVTLGVSEKIETTPDYTRTLRAESVYDNPVFFHDIITYDNRPVAYLLYNHFTSGVDDDSQFDNSLKEAFTEFKGSTFNEFILDLRYNNGGLVSCARLLASLLAPEEADKDIFCKLKYDKDGKDDYNYNFDLSLGDNLNLNKLYIITSSSTASASEAVINGLKPFLGNDLILVGETTEGKNVGSITITDDNNKFNWEMHPIVCRVTNKDGDNSNYEDYTDGFPPTYECDEYPFENWEELGNPKEYMLNQVLEHITKGTSIVPQTPQRSSQNLRSSESSLSVKRLSSSLDRKKSVIIVD